MPKKPPKGNGTLPLSICLPASDWAPPVLSELPSWENEPVVSIDTEFEDETLGELGLGARRGVKIAGYSFAFLDGRKYYIPVRHPEGNVDCEQGMRYARDQAKHYTGTVVGANLPTELDLFQYEPTGAITFPAVKIFRDVQMWDALIWELHFQYNLGIVCERRGVPGKNEELLRQAVEAFGYPAKGKKWKKYIPKLPAKYVGPYGEDDALACIRLLPSLQKDTDEQGLQQVVDIESRLMPILLKIKQRGVLIDQDQLDKVEAYSRAKESQYLDEIQRLSGYRIPNGKTMTTAMCAAAFEGAGLQVPKSLDKRTGQYKPSVDKEFLNSCPHPIAKFLLKARKAGKIYGTFVTSIRDHMTNGRIHCTFKQIVGSSDDSVGDDDTQGAAFGRMSAVDPNLQQQPSDKEYGPLWRSIYIPEPGSLWGCLDYAAQEPRWTTHHAARLNLNGAKEAAIAYCSNPKIDPHALMAEITGLERTPSKIIFLGLCYGEGGAKLCTQLGLPTRWCIRYRESGAVEYYQTKAEVRRARLNYDGEASYYEVAGEEGQKVLDRFNKYAPFVRELAKLAENQAKKIGKINLLGGRVVHFPQKENGEWDFTYKALNRKIQGDSGMQMKLAIIEIDRIMPNTYLQLIVHDEADGSFQDIWEMKKCAKIMREVAGDTNVPFRIDIETGPNWGRMSQVCGRDDCCDFVNKELEVWTKNYVEASGTKETYYCPKHTDLEWYNHEKVQAAS